MFRVVSDIYEVNEEYPTYGLAKVRCEDLQGVFKEEQIKMLNERNEGSIS